MFIISRIVHFCYIYNMALSNQFYLNLLITSCLSALLIAICLTCGARYSIGESYFKDLASKSRNICSDGGCTCNEGETCCKDNSEYYCCPGANATCCGERLTLLYTKLISFEMLNYNVNFYFNKDFFLFKVMFLILKEHFYNQSVFI